MLDGSWLHGYLVRSPAGVENFRDDAGFGRGCFGASAAVMREGRPADHEALIAKRLVHQLCPRRILEGCHLGLPALIDKNASVLNSVVSDLPRHPTCLRGPHTAPFLQKQHCSHLKLACDLSLSLFSLLPLPTSSCCSASNPFSLVLSIRCLFS
jgi:hypothetical protein